MFLKGSFARSKIGMQMFFATKRARNKAPYLHAKNIWHVLNWHFIIKSHVDQGTLLKNSNFDDP